MTEHSAGPPGRRGGAGTPLSLAAIAAAAIACGVGWLALSWLVMHETVRDAAGEALGVVFGVLILISVIGAVRGYARRAANPGDDPEKPS
ncbi:MAG: hypothetical protein HOV79_23840 [Hamadaea sp.]|nr:hypothetical protein [Hamadaea sp.]